MNKPAPKDEAAPKPAPKPAPNDEKEAGVKKGHLKQNASHTGGSRSKDAPNVDEPSESSASCDANGGDNSAIGDAGVEKPTTR